MPILARIAYGQFRNEYSIGTGMFIGSGILGIYRCFVLTNSLNRALCRVYLE
ncbi:hypothetical protein C427_3098 [Paraglaciecola psychrophila 170]|uniref:Uncharacterized protein n=1 Tax=Paraglaciecola psychrophila 170 TaxID=1129794 RepID=K7AFZ4_9ALTE|nr:hypothetical protein C427_3098 [Paraglaciecola psychrophila 170]GAC39558.1 hypothetical protein GPSY_3947 [Paraglaciecola psychrophila 170]